MSRDLLFETSRFNLSRVKPHFINDCCFGEDLAAWLREKLAAEGISAIEPGQEDWGWYIEATHDGRTYFIGIGGNSAEDPSDPDRGEWRIMIERHRSLMDKLRGRNRMTPDEPIVDILRRLLEQEPGFSKVTEETGP